MSGRRKPVHHSSFGSHQSSLHSSSPVNFMLQRETENKAARAAVSLFSPCPSQHAAEKLLYSCSRQEHWLAQPWMYLSQIGTIRAKAISRQRHSTSDKLVCKHVCFLALALKVWNQRMEAHRDREEGDSLNKLWVKHAIHTSSVNPPHTAISPL